LIALHCFICHLKQKKDNTHCSQQTFNLPSIAFHTAAGRSAKQSASDQNKSIGGMYKMFDLIRMPSIMTD